jgi:tryptophan-rich sensory protein
VTRISLRIVPLLLALQALSAYLLWSLNPTSQTDESEFAIFLAVIFVSLSMVSYMFRVEKRGDNPSRVLLLAGCLMVLILLFAGLLV